MKSDSADCKNTDGGPEATLDFNGASDDATCFVAFDCASEEMKSDSAVCKNTDGVPDVTLDFNGSSAQASFDGDIKIFNPNFKRDVK